ncbi:type II toxin-antitoxin system VapC family toxin [Halonotius aquaticus]|uniref:Type II toxin-antitoxin system VapC family toxin n=1 Tax=Halonotius aquaticus TaxID=2216978 RepID=A0A3A6PS79_9EURY|nr:PIN domain-containing protein [Halonotius aquaticus]RJX42350.1 type II toxin-antitoxin system VapC family toxin [Halonotius aquaticus]
MTISDRVVFDAEPLVAHADDEPGSEVVEDYLDAVAADDTTGYVSYVTLTEVRYILSQKYDRGTADEYIDWLTDLGIEPVGVADCWQGTADHVLSHNPALGDAFALATADHLDATLLVGADDDYDAVDDVSITRFRNEAG